MKVRGVVAGAGPGAAGERVGWARAGAYGIAGVTHLVSAGLLAGGSLLVVLGWETGVQPLIGLVARRMPEAPPRKHRGGNRRHFPRRLDRAFHSDDCFVRCDRSLDEWRCIHLALDWRSCVQHVHLRDSRARAEREHGQDNERCLEHDDPPVAADHMPG